MKNITPEAYEELLLRLKVLEEKVYKDPLTSVYNRRLYDELRFLPSCPKSAARTIGFIMADVEQFKFINDCYGHVAGDDCLRKVAHVFTQNISSDDFVIRYGGDEFLLILNNRTHEQMSHMISSLKAQIAEIRFSKYPTLRIHVNVFYFYMFVRLNNTNFFPILK